MSIRFGETVKVCFRNERGSLVTYYFPPALWKSVRDEVAEWARDAREYRKAQGIR
jgi:hypothetical protein